MIEGLFYKKLEGGMVHCLLCPHGCKIKPGGYGICRVRHNQDGILYVKNYGLASSIAMDPIEKKPLYHFYPGSSILSLGTEGCNLKCGFCQNWTISQMNPPMKEISPQWCIDVASQFKDKGCIGIAYTYSEPSMWFEFVLDTAKLARSKGLKNVLVTNGYLNLEPLEELLPWVDAMNIDLKAFSDDFYKKVCKGSLEPVLKTLKRAAGTCHVEVTTLLIPGYNDSHDEIKHLVDWVASIDTNIPLHFSKYYPNYEFNVEATPQEALYSARAVALERLKYVYIGNLGDPDSLTTYCHNCGDILITRSGMGIDENRLRNGKCPGCSSEIDIII